MMVELFLRLHGNNWPYLSSKGAGSAGKETAVFSPTYRAVRPQCEFKMHADRVVMALMSFSLRGIPPI